MQEIVCVNVFSAHNSVAACRLANQHMPYIADFLILIYRKTKATLFETLD